MEVQGAIYTKVGARESESKNNFMHEQKLSFGEKPKHKIKLSERLKFQQMCSVREKEEAKRKSTNK